MDEWLSIEGGDTDFHKWVNKASSNNIASIVSDEFYRRRETGEMSAFVIEFDDGTSFRFPDYTLDSWKELDEDISNIIEINNTGKQPVNDSDALNSVAQQLAYRTGESPERAEITDHLWNGETYTVTHTSDSKPLFSVGESEFFSHLSTVHPLSKEIYVELYQNGVSPNISRQDINSIIDNLDLSYREKKVPKITDVIGRQSKLDNLIGITATPVIRFDGEYRLMLLKRGEEVASSPGQYSTVGGMYDPESADPVEHLLREFVEELFDAPEGTNPIEHEFGTQLIESLNDTVHLDYLVSHVDSLTTNYHIRLSLFINNEELGKYLVENYETNFEAREVIFRRTNNIEWFKELIKQKQLSPPTAPSVFLALKHIDREYGGIDASWFETSW